VARACTRRDFADPTIVQAEKLKLGAHCSTTAYFDNCIIIQVRALLPTPPNRRI
jgi:hypothetical protein